MRHLEDMGFKMPKQFVFRGYDEQRHRVPLITELGPNTAESETRKKKIFAEFKPKFAAIEKAQTSALLNVVSADIPGMKEEMEKLRQAITDVVGDDPLVSTD
jgi:hypothetical protein